MDYKAQMYKSIIDHLQENLADTQAECEKLQAEKAKLHENLKDKNEVVSCYYAELEDLRKELSEAKRVNKELHSIVTDQQETLQQGLLESHRLYEQALSDLLDTREVLNSRTRELDHAYKQLQKEKECGRAKFTLDNYQYGHAKGYLQGYEDGKASQNRDLWDNNPF